MDMKLLDNYGRRGRMMKSRSLARAAALLNGYFWLPCPLCRQDFAGFECFTDGLAVTQDGTFGVCSRERCKEEGARIKRDVYRQLEDEGILPLDRPRMA